MTAPVRYTREQMAKCLVKVSGLIRAIQAHGYQGDPAELFTDTDRRMLREAAAMLRQAVEIREWQHTSFNSAQPDGTMLCPLCDQSEARGHAPDCCAIEWAKTLTEPPVGDVFPAGEDVDAFIAAARGEPRGTCGTCRHFQTTTETLALRTGPFEIKYVKCAAWGDENDARYENVPADGSGFCHLWEAK